jgi:hypothetical protein
MRWTGHLDRKIDVTKFSTLVFRYRAENLDTEKSRGNDYVLWLFDGRTNHYGGFVAVQPYDIIPDGKAHELRVDLAALKPFGRISQIAIQVFSSGEGKALLQIEELQFVPLTGVNLQEDTSGLKKTRL